MCLRLTLSALLLVSTSLVPAHAADPVTAWTGLSGPAWPDAANWTNGVPGDGSAAIIDGAAHQPVLGAPGAEALRVQLGTSAGTSTLKIENGGTLDDGNAFIAAHPNSTADVSVAGAGSRWSNSGVLYLGLVGSGGLSISGGGEASTEVTVLGNSAGSSGTATIRGENSTFTSNDVLYVGKEGKGSLTISGNGAAHVGSGGITSIAAEGASTAMVDITDGGTLTGGNAFVAGSHDAAAQATVSGKGSKWASAGAIYFGQSGTATLDIADQGQMNANVIVLGDDAGSSGIATVINAGSNLASVETLTVGRRGSGALTVSDKATVDAEITLVGDAGGGQGTLRVDSGAVLNSTYSFVGAQSNADNRVSVTGNGSKWSNSKDLYVGETGRASLAVSDQAEITSESAFIGNSAGSVGSATATGENTRLASSKELVIGKYGRGDLTLTDGAVYVTPSITLGRYSGGEGILNIGAGSGLQAQAAGRLEADALAFGAGGGTLVFNHTGDDYHFTAELSGAGMIAVEHGRTVLTADSLGFRGSTAIAEGAVLQIGDGRSHGNWAGAVSNDGKLVFDRSDASTFSGDVSGTGSLIKAGAGTLELSGNSTGFTGATTIAEGGLRVNGSLARSAVAVKRGAVLSGNGTVGDITAEGGSVIAPGNDQGTLRVAGNLRQMAGARYIAELSPDAALSDQIAVKGVATLESGAILDVAEWASGSYRIGDVYTVLTADGGVNGVYTLSGATSLSSFYDLQTAYDAHNVYLIGRQTRSFTEAASTPNETATAGGLQSLPAGNTLRDAVAMLPSDAAAQNAFNQLSGEIQPSIAGAMVEDSRFVRNAALSRLRCADDPPSASRPPPRRAVQGCGESAVWAQGYGAWQALNGDGNAASFGDDSGGLVAGVDGSLAGLRLGLIGSFGNSNYDVNRRNSSGSAQGFSLGAYGGMVWDNVDLRLGGAYGWSSVSTTRDVAFAGYADRLTADYDAATAQAFGELGYRIDVGPASLEPIAGFAYVNVHDNGFQEDGGAAALSGDAGSTAVAFSTLGLRAVTDFSFAGLDFSAQGLAGWRHGWGDMTPEATLDFAGSDDFRIRGVPLSANMATLEAGIAANVTDTLSLGVLYQGQFGEDTDTQDLSGQLSFAL